MLKKQFFINLAAIIVIAGVLVWACKDPFGPGIDLTGLRDYIPLSQRANGPGFTNNITYGDNNAIDPKYMLGNKYRVYTNAGGVNYRIPALLTLLNGDILAFADKRMGGSGDLPNKIDVVVKKALITALIGEMKYT